MFAFQKAISVVFDSVPYAVGSKSEIYLKLDIHICKAEYQLYCLYIRCHGLKVNIPLLLITEMIWQESREDLVHVPTGLRLELNYSILQKFLEVDLGFVRIQIICEHFFFSSAVILNREEMLSWCDG